MAPGFRLALVGFSLVLLAAVFPGLKVGAATPNFQGVGRVRASDSTEAWDVSDDGSVVAAPVIMSAITGGRAQVVFAR